MRTERVNGQNSIGPAGQLRSGTSKRAQLLARGLCEMAVFIEACRDTTDGGQQVCSVFWSPKLSYCPEIPEYPEMEVRHLSKLLAV